MKQDFTKAEETAKKSYDLNNEIFDMVDFGTSTAAKSLKANLNSENHIPAFLRQIRII